MTIINRVDAAGIPIKQGSSAWHALRLGIPTASEFGRILTPKRMDYSAGARAYIAELLAEQILGHPLEMLTSDFMARGTELESQARQWYELERDVEVEQVAFVTDAEPATEGGSPDGLVGTDGLIEVKCLSAKEHMLRLLGEEPVATASQVQGLLRVTEREWCDCIAYSAPSEISGKRLPPRLDRVWRDETYQDALGSCLDLFKLEMAQAKERLDLIGPEGVIDDGGLLSQLAASLRQRFKSHPDALAPDEVTAFEGELAQAVERGVIDEADARRILADVNAGRWEEVRAMRDHIARAIGLELVP